ncbi:Cys-tRNA(Pro) deacylase [Peptostreptococcus equinus]|uniref:Cys-tRNA(Pro)/Cys-tRNA(Cys) deacylase n=1 Tax=Peptostreptococcus equinus TaxID=3003601 RepID=A0ABY7JTX3_9FIRM|nr:Cys-tRNA(Pro) deacylase [Peptostreptococcus sp. CBA3647]WAW15513.1 Cys-tRNA(Pro) deacylase [Peptostreptococcus sp. CBA3647]
MSKKNIKTNAMRLLESENIDYNFYTYSVEKEHVDGVTAAKAIGKDPKSVFKTLVTQANSKEYYVFVIPVGENLDLKKAAKVSKEKKVEMIHVKDITKVTGYIRGGCSPLAMKKVYKTFIDKSAKDQDKIIVSAGKIGYQIELSAEKLIKILDASFEELTI